MDFGIYYLGVNNFRGRAILYRMGSVVIVLVFFLFSCSLAAADSKHAEKLQDVFAHTNIRLDANQSIGRLLVAGGDAVVLGSVDEGIVIVDGNLVIAAGAQVQGGIVVLGGHIEQQPNSQVKGKSIAVGPLAFPIVNWILGSLAAVIIISLAVLPYILCSLLRLAEHFSLYLHLKKELLNIQHHWPVLYILLALAISASMLALFFELAWKTIFRQTMGMFDNTVIWLVRYFATPQLDPIMIAITNLGFGFTYGLIVFCSFLILIFYRQWLEFAGLAICLAGGAVLNFLLKNLFERARPDEFVMVAATGYSFPSGHAMVSLCFYGMLAFLIARNIRQWQYRYGIAVLTMLFITAIGVSRIYLGVHYPSDVVAGYTAGAVWLTLTVSLLWWWEEQRRLKESKPQ